MYRDASIYKVSEYYGQVPWSSGYGRRLVFQGLGFKSQRRILDGRFFTFICCKNCSVCFVKMKINKMRPGKAHFLKNSEYSLPK